MKRILALLMVFLIGASVMTGCGNKTANKAAGSSVALTKAAGTQDTAKQSSNFPMTVKDAKGVEMTIEKKPEKIVSLTLGTDEMLFALVDKSRIKGITTLSTDPGLSNIIDIAKDFPVKLGSDVEKVISLQPDIVFVADWTDEKVKKQLRDAKILVYACKTPNSLDEQKAEVTEIAKLVGEDSKGQDVIKTMDDKLKAVDAKVKTVTEDKKLTAISLDSFFYTYGANTTFDDIAKKAGVVNLSSKTGIQGWQQISKEKVVELNPDVIFLPSWSYEGFDAKKFAEDFKNDKSLASVKAIKNNKVFMLPEAHMTSVSQNMVLGVEDMAKAVYPDLFK